MSNFLLAWDNQADAATLTLGSWNASYPLDSLKDYRLTKRARSADAAEASTKLRFALASKSHVGAVGLMANNLSADASSQLLLYSDAGFTTQIYDSGSVPAYPVGSIGQTPFGGPNWWTGKPLPADIARWQRNLVHILPDAMYAQYGELRIADTGNSAGYVEAGRLFVGQAWQPTNNVAIGDVSLRPTSRTTMARAIDGTPYWNALRASFGIPFSLKWLTVDEAMRMLDMQVLVDTHGEVLVMWDPDEVPYAFRRRVFGRLARLDPIEYPLFATYTAAFQVEGVL